MAPIVGYWNIRGLAAPIRYLLEYANVEYKDKLYNCGPPPSFDRTEWMNDKFSLGIQLPNLPYYIDGDVKLSQTDVILRYLANKHGLHGKTESEKLFVEMVHSHLKDYIMEFGRICYNPAFNDLKADYIKAMPDKIKVLSDLIGDKKFVVGDYVTYADFVLFEYLELQSLLIPDLLKDSPVLQAYHKRILDLESMKRYFNSPKAIKYPFNGAPARFGGQYSDQL